MTDFLVRRDDLRVWKVTPGSGMETLELGEVQLRVERFGLTRVLASLLPGAPPHRGGLPCPSSTASVNRVELVRVR